MKRILLMAYVLVTMIVLGNGKHQGSPVPAPVDCSEIAFDMADCITYLQNGSDESKPEDSCCSGFEAVLNLDADCLCYALKHSADFGIEVNLTRAASLSSDCGVSATPPKCDMPPAAGSPANPPSTPTPSTPTPSTPTPEPAPPKGTPPPPKETPPSPPPTDNQPSAPAPPPSNTSNSGGAAAPPPAVSDSPNEAPAKATANSISAPSLIVIICAVASALSIFV